MADPVKRAADARAKRAGWRFLLAGAVLIVAGVIVVLVADGWWGDGFGALVAAFGIPLAVIGATVLTGRATARWAEQDKPFA